MKAAYIRKYGNNDVVEIGDQPLPSVGSGDVLIKIHAASINPVDYKIRDGDLKRVIAFKFPLILGNDGSGVVEKVGADVRAFRPGDAVYVRLDKERIGTFAEYAVVTESSVALKPNNLSHIEAASIPLAGQTAWQALIEFGKLQKGQKVLIHAGSGGVGSFAIQLAKHVGATVATTTSAKNADLVKRLGADVVIDYKTQRFDEMLSDYDFVLDTQGGDIQHRSFRVLKRGGALVTIVGMPTAEFGREWGVNVLVRMVMAWANRKSTQLARERDVKFKFLFMRPSGDQLREIAKLIESGAINPMIDKVFDLDHIREALAFSESGRVAGKAVVQVFSG
jgi:NADPH:quinone reductase-like Zn-dependent oxidoreductase